MAEKQLTLAELRQLIPSYVSDDVLKDVFNKFAGLTENPETIKGLVRKDFFRPPAPIADGRNQSHETHTQRIERYTNNITQVVEHFKPHGLTLNQYLKAATKQPSLFYQKPETRNNTKQHHPSRRTLQTTRPSTQPIPQSRNKTTATLLPETRNNLPKTQVHTCNGV